MKTWLVTCLCMAFIASTISTPTSASDYPPPKQGSWVARDFRFHTGETLPELRIAYTTVGSPTGIPVVLLHGTLGSGSNFLTPQFAGELFGAGQPLDASKFYIIMPDAIGTGKTSKPSDGLRSKFPHYNYTDLVEAQHRLLTEGLGIQHVRLVLGSSMGGMESWLFAEAHPDFMDGIVPLASTPARMSGRNWLTRRLLIETIKRDPEYKNGDYSIQPASVKIADAWFGVVSNGGTRAYAKAVQDAEAGDKLVAQRLNAPSRADANDMIFQYEASANYDPSPSLEKIKVPVLAINSEDDERNPPELGAMDLALKRLKNARMVLIPAGPDSRGHGTTGAAKLWKDDLASFLSNLPSGR